MKLFAGFASTLVMVGVAHAQTPAFDPRSWKGQHVGVPTQVLTLGSSHLSELPTPPTREMLAPLIDKLAAFKPDIITHEGISGEQCDVLKRFAARYPDMFDSYCFNADAAAKVTGLDVPGAMAAIETTLASWPTLPSASQRRRLAALFLAANDRPSAQVQWQQLPAVERVTGDGVDPGLLKILMRSGAKPNETYEVAVTLAVRLGLQRVYAVDDHTADSVQAVAGSGFEPFMKKHWADNKGPFYAEYERRSKTDTLAFFRFLNRPATQRAFVTLDYRGAINRPSSDNYGRMYLAWWETRNLRMVANIRAAFGNRPGARVLNIVGASHKPYYDAYFNMMSDVKLIDAEHVLK